MQYLTIIKNDLPTILEQLHDDILNDPLVAKLEDMHIIENRLNKQSDLLMQIFSQYSEAHNHVDENQLWDFYKDEEIPFNIVYKSLNALKMAVLQRLLDQLDNQDEIFAIERFIDDLLNQVAKIYIRKDIVKIAALKDAKFKEYLLFRAHHQWLGSLYQAIADDDLDKFPLASADGCLFSEYLQFPESLMVCMDANLCTNLHSIHVLIHRNANTLYLFYAKQEYYQAYLVFRELLEQLINFNKTLTELYFVSYNNLEENFFKLIELLLYQKSDIYLTIIDFKALRLLNTTYGEKRVNAMLAQVSEDLQQIVHNRESDTLLIKGVTANYYMLSVDIDHDAITRLNQRLYAIANQDYKIEGKEINLRATLVTLSLNGFFESNRDDLTKMMLHLKNQYKDIPSSTYIHEHSEKTALKQWIDAAYKDIDFITQKLQDRQVDIVFQPIFNIQSGKVEIMEALARIPNNGKLIPAGAFIDTIYDIDKIELLDQLVLERLIEKSRQIKQVTPTLFINVSYRSLFDEKYSQTFVRFLKTFQEIEVIFELTEQKIVENMDKILDLHREQGISFAVDDFGSGFSSLKTVSDLAQKGVLKVLKMDGEIINNIESNPYTGKIVRVISKLSQALDLYSVAEFIENRATLDILEKIGINYGQGYYLSKPSPIEELLVLKLNQTLDYNSRERNTIII